MASIGCSDPVGTAAIVAVVVACMAIPGCDRSVAPAPPDPKFGLGAEDPFAEVPRPPNERTPDPDPRMAIARSMLRSERFDDAERALATILAARPDDARVELLLGLAIQKQKRYADAKPRFERVIALRQSFPEVDHVFYLLGWAEYYLGDGDAARRAFEEHRRRVPNEPDTRFGLGLIAFDEDRIEDAEALFRETIALQPDDPRAARDVAKAQARLGDALLRRDRLDDAEAAYREAVRLHADHYEAWAKLARTLDRLGRHDEAQAARVEEAAAMRRVGR